MLPTAPNAPGALPAKPTATILQKALLAQVLKEPDSSEASMNSCTLQVPPSPPHSTLNFVGGGGSLPSYPPPSLPSLSPSLPPFPILSTSSGQMFLGLSSSNPSGTSRLEVVGIRNLLALPCLLPAFFLPFFSFVLTGSP